MSSTFSISRLQKLVTKQFFENSKLYLYAILALLGLLSLVFAFWFVASRPNYDEEATYLIFIFGLFITGSVFASMSFHMLGSKDRGIYWLSIPATHLEKLVCTIFYTTIVFTTVYCLCFFLIKWIALLFVQGLMSGNPLVTYTEMKVDEGFAKVLPNFIYAYFAVQALYLLGSVYFTRFTFIMTTVVAAVLIFAFAYYISQLDDMIAPLDWDIISAKEFTKGIKDGYRLYSLSPFITDLLKYTVQFVWAPLFWVITWFRLKEKEL